MVVSARCCLPAAFGVGFVARSVFRRATSWGWGLLAILLSWAGLPRGAAADVTAVQRRIEDLARDVATLAREASVRVGEERARYVEERLADADMFFRLGFYEEASVLYLDLVENVSDHMAYADALFYLGLSLYKMGDPYGAREFFERVLQHSRETRFRPYVQQALGRLIEIALRTEDFAAIERYFAELSRLPAAEVAAVTPYFRGKYYYHRGELPQAERAFLAVPDNAEYTLRARYFLGVVYTRMYKERGNPADLEKALQAFRSVLVSPAQTAEDRLTVDLANLAIGRIEFERQRWDAAIESYQRISTDSEAFDDALYEVSWVHLGRGETTRARRALEMLLIYDPESRHAPEARLLLANILLREGRVVANEECFLLAAEQAVAREAARELGESPPALPELPAMCAQGAPGTVGADTTYAVNAFQVVRVDYGPIREQVARAMSSREDLRTFFREMVRSDAGAAATTSLLPPEARAWFLEHRDLAQVQQVLDSLGTIRRFVRETERLVVQLQAILSGRTVVGAFMELRQLRDRAEILWNRCARIRLALASELDGIPAPGGGAAAARAQRRALDAAVGRLPVDAEGLDSAYDAQRRAVDAVSHLLTQTTHTVEFVYTMSRALEEYLISPANWGGLSESEVEALRAEARLVRGAVEHYRTQAAALRRQVDALRAQTHVGEVSSEAAQDIRERYRQAVAHEIAALAASAAGGAALSRIQSALDQLARVEADLAIVQRSLESQAQDRSRELLEKVERERRKLEDYRSRLASVEDTAAEVVGGYAFENFERIARQFEDLILRADMGVADSAWILVEEHTRRHTEMGRRRDRELDAIRLDYEDLAGTQEVYDGQ